LKGTSRSVNVNRTVVGVIVGGLLGLVDGLSAWSYPEARPMIVAIVIGSTVKGVLTGLVAGLIARRWHSLRWGIVAGVAVGFVLSTLAALGEPGQYWAIVLPGMLVGAIVGAVTQRYPARATNVARTRVLIWLLLPMVACAATTRAGQLGNADRNELSQLDGLIGRWQGTSEGRPGNGTVEREYSRLFGSRFVQVRNRAIYKPQDKNPKGEAHEDTGIFSFDTTRRRIIFRQFHTEGFVNQYVADSPSKPGSLVFTTEAIENIPAGWRARETYTLVGRDELEEIFELAEPGKGFEVYSRSRMKRVP
jgi:hypothetical protein